MGNGMGVMLHTGDLAYPDLIRYAQESEKLDYDTFYVTEESGKEAFSLLGVLAQNTSTIGLGSSIINFYSRTPTLLAMGARSMHELSGGRFGPFGLGTGGVGFMQRGHGIELDRPIGRARETVEIVRSLLTQPRTTYDGKWFNVNDFRLREGGLEEGVHIPLWLAGLGPKMVAMAAKVADGVITNWLMPESLAEVREIITKEAAGAGRDPGDVTIAALTMMCVDPDAEDAIWATRRGLAFYCASEHYLHIADIAGLGAEARKVKEVWETRDFDAATRLVTDEMVETFSVTGTPEKCARTLHWMLDEGVVPIIYPLPRHSNMVEDHFTTIQKAASYLALPAGAS